MIPARETRRPGSRSLSRVGHLAIGAVAAAATLIAPVSASFAQDSGNSGPQINLIRDTEIEEILHEDADPIFRAAGIDPKATHLYLVGDNDLNAFTAGGQNIFINTGLIIRTKNPNQLTGVMAHEIGHMAGGHLVRSGEGEKQALATYLLTMGLGMLAAVGGAPDAAAGLIGSSGEFAYLTAAGFTRVQEASADQAALTYLEKAGESGRGIVDFFDNFRYEEVFDDARRYKFFQDHPLSGDRIDALRLRAEQLLHYNVVDSPVAIAKHAIMVAKLRAFMNLPQQTFLDYPESDTSFPAQYARAIAYYRDLETDKALKLENALIADHPDDPYLYELKGQTLFEIGRATEAEPAEKRSVDLKPDAPILRLNYGQVLLGENNPAKLDQAVTEIRRSLDVENDNPFAWRLLSQAYDQKNEPGMARLAAAEENFALGQAAEARVFGMRARMLLPKDSPEWRRATDIVLVSNPTPADLRALAQEGSTNGTIKR
jgi:predicted Zn-dependent protease